MKEVTVYQGQTLVDIAVQELGDASRAREIAKLNNLSITAELTPMQVILVPDFALDKKAIVKVFSDPFNQPASGGQADIEGLVPVGIEYWTIEQDFIVN